MKIITPEFKPFTVRLSYLKRKGACGAQRDEFESRFGKKLIVTKDKLPELYKDFDIRWFIDVAMYSPELSDPHTYYLNLYLNANDRSYDKYMAALKGKRMLDKWGFVRNLSAKRQKEYDAIYEARVTTSRRARHRYFTRCLSHLGGMEFR